MHSMHVAQVRCHHLLWLAKQSTNRGRLIRPFRGACPLPFRLMVVNKLFDPLSDETEALLKQLNSDRLYIRLCRSQACFRARLTPKPWRCGSKSPPNAYPREESQAEQLYLGWLRQYEQKSEGYVVCRLVDELGGSGVAEPVRAVLGLHDEYVLRDGAKALA